MHGRLSVRIILGTANVAALGLLRRAIGRAFGRDVSRWWAVFTISQFHLTFWLSRTLGNCLAFAPSNRLHRTLQRAARTHAAAC
jgi:alpha-1,6-mannosyltransferase